jgi:hypothetical protein
LEQQGLVQETFNFGNETFGIQILKHRFARHLPFEQPPEPASQPQLACSLPQDGRSQARPDSQPHADFASHPQPVSHEPLLGITPLPKRKFTCFACWPQTAVAMITLRAIAMMAMLLDFMSFSESLNAASDRGPRRTSVDHEKFL